jgi:uncharacterized repeat protein (TIGR03803 family)
MKTPALSFCVLLAGCVAFAACSQAIELSRFQYTANVDALHDREARPMSSPRLHSFGAPTDGGEPLAGKIYKHGRLIGTTKLGGAYGYGTVFSLTPSR